jgi:hypothetical protein
VGRRIKGRIDGYGSSSSSNRSDGELTLPAARGFARGYLGLRRGSARRAFGVEDDGEANEGRERC